MTIYYPESVKDHPVCIKSFDNHLRYLLDIDLKNDFVQNMLFIMMNPSKADGTVSDDTINRCIGYCEELNNDYDMKIGCLSIVNVIPFYDSQSKSIYNTMLGYYQQNQSGFIKALDDNILQIKKKLSETSFVSLGTGEKPKIDISRKDAPHLHKKLTKIREYYINSRYSIYDMLGNFERSIFVYWPESSQYELVQADKSAKHLSFWNVSPETKICLSVAKINRRKLSILESKKYAVKLKYGNGKNY